MDLQISYLLLILATSQVISAQNANVSTSTTPEPMSTSSSTAAPMQPTQGPTTPAPLMPRKPDWTVKGPTGSCVLFAGDISLAVTYDTISGSTNNGQIMVPKSATATGSCAPFMNQMVLTWSGQGAMANSLTFVFIKRPVYDPTGNITSQGTYDVTTVYGSITPEFPDAMAGQMLYVGAKPTFGTNLQSSFKCVTSQTVYADKNGMSQITFADVQAEAFHEGAADTFSPETVCAKDTISSVLPIIGYVVAGVLVAGALGTFAYMKFPRGGYNSV